MMHQIQLFTEFGGAVPYRPAEDLAFSVAKFIQTGGSFINYYMYHGGTNFGRTSGGPFIADYDAPLDEFDGSFTTNSLGPVSVQALADFCVQALSTNSSGRNNEDGNDDNT